MIMVINIISWICLIIGALFVLVGTIGLLRLPNFFTRLHAAGLVDTLGVMLIVLGLILQVSLGLVTFKLLLISIFILFTSPAATHALAKSALHGGLRPEVKE